ncbi:Oligopeptide-binding protein OppA [bacterium HR23]|nr:Oligopeptide-binding protein OppA [bacterium HR23]
MSARWSGLLLGGLLVLLVGACRAAPAPTPTPTRAPAPPAMLPTPTPVPPTPTPAPKAPTVLRANLGTEPTTLDPALVKDSPSVDVVRALFVGITNQTEDTGAVIPDLAERWTVSADGTGYTFTLRRDVKWTDGKSVTARDAEYGGLRTLDPKTASEYAYVPAGIIKGGEDFNRGKADASQVGIRAVDDWTITYTLNYPAGFFPALASMWVLMPQPRWAIEQHKEKWIEPGNIVTNGPYLLRSWEHEKSLVLEKNPNYYDAPHVQIDRIEFVMVKEASTALAMYEAGQLDTLYNLGVPLGEIDRVKKDPVLSKELYIAPRPITYYYGFNVTKPPVDKALVRKALIASIDRQGLIDNVLKGGQRPALTFTAPGNFGFVDGEKEGIGIPFNPDQAKRWLAEAGYPNGRGWPSDVVLMYNTSEGHKRIAEAISAMWKQHLNIDVKVVNQDWAVYLKTLSQDPPHIWRLGWGADYLDADNWMSVFLSDSGNNHTMWKNTRFDALVKQAAREQDPAKRLQLYKEAERLLVQEDAVIAPIYFYTTVQLTKPYLKRTYSALVEQFKNWRIER